jgi:hypothetical protein
VARWITQFWKSEDGLGLIDDIIIVGTALIAGLIFFMGGVTVYQGLNGAFIAQNATSEAARAGSYYAMPDQEAQAKNMSMTTFYTQLEQVGKSVSCSRPTITLSGSTYTVSTSCSIKTDFGYIYHKSYSESVQTSKYQGG